MVRRRKAKGAGEEAGEKDRDVFFCYYCDRDFDDEQTLIIHQKNKHWKCEDCMKKVNSIGGLRIHCRNVHKMDIKT